MLWQDQIQRKKNHQERLMLFSLKIKMSGQEPWAKSPSWMLRSHTSILIWLESTLDTIGHFNPNIRLIMVEKLGMLSEKDEQKYFKSKFNNFQNWYSFLFIHKSEITFFCKEIMMKWAEKKWNKTIRSYFYGLFFSIRIIFFLNIFDGLLDSFFS